MEGETTEWRHLVSEWKNTLELQDEGIKLYCSQIQNDGMSVM